MPPAAAWISTTLPRIRLDGELGRSYPTGVGKRLSDILSGGATAIIIAETPFLNCGRNSILMENPPGRRLQDCVVVAR